MLLLPSIFFQFSDMLHWKEQVNRQVWLDKRLNKHDISVLYLQYTCITHVSFIIF